MVQHRTVGARKSTVPANAAATRAMHNSFHRPEVRIHKPALFSHA